MFGLGIGELVFIFLIIFLLFGPKALPEIARSLGEAIKTFKKEAEDVSSSINSPTKSIDKPSTDQTSE